MSLDLLRHSYGRYRGLSSECFISCDFPFHIVTSIVGSAAHSSAMKMPRVVAILHILSSSSVVEFLCCIGFTYTLRYIVHHTYRPYLLHVSVLALSPSPTHIPSCYRERHTPSGTNDPRVSRDGMPRSFSFPHFVFHLRSSASPSCSVFITSVILGFLLPVSSWLSFLHYSDVPTKLGRQRRICRGWVWRLQPSRLLLRQTTSIRYRRPHRAML